jgi:hypothetical protein
MILLCTKKLAEDRGLKRKLRNEQTNIIINIEFRKVAETTEKEDMSPKDIEGSTSLAGAKTSSGNENASKCRKTVRLYGRNC